MIKISRYLLVLCILLCHPVSAGEIQSSSISYQQGVYKLAIDVIIDAQFEAVYGIVTDYERLHRLSKSFIESALIETAEPDTKRRRLVLRSCILFFCFKLIIVEDIQEVGQEVILMTMVPEQSDFKSGKTQWHVTALADGRSRIQLYCDVTPGFWVPPLIGPILVKNKFLQLAKESIRQIELLANES